MAKISMAFWSGTGNTQKMAELIGEGAEQAGAQVVCKSIDSTSVSEALSGDICVLGCPSMGDEVLEEDTFEPFIAKLCEKVDGKKIALFGTYGWGDGQWMREWQERMKNAGAQMPVDFIIVQEMPEGSEAERCKVWGAAVAKA